MTIERFQTPTNGSYVHGSGADNPYWGAFAINDIHTVLDNLASSEEQVILHEVHGMINLKLTKDDGSGRPGAAIWPLITISRVRPTNQYQTSDSSLEGFLGSAQWFNSEFEYQSLQPAQVAPHMVFFNPVSTNYEWVYKIPIHFKVPKNRKKVFRSSEQYVDTPNIYKMITFALYAPDGTVQSFVYWTGAIEYRFSRIEKNLFDQSHL